MSSFVVLGGPASGKTHYAGQMYGRMARGRSAATITGGVADLTVLEEVLHCLQDGRSAPHTPVNTMAELRCSLVLADGRQADIVWPDYGGEQVRAIVASREVPDAWRQSLAEAQAWLLFVRAGRLQTLDDAFSRRATDATGSDTPRPWDDNAWYVELLQLALMAGGRDVTRPIKSPRLVVMISCWDEVATHLTPLAFFKRKLPLLAAFIAANWSADSWSVWGLSALGRALSTTEADDAYLDEGPESFGYVLAGDSQDRNPDLLAPILWLMRP